MTVFARHRTLQELRAVCSELGLPLQDAKYRAGTSTTVVVGRHGRQGWRPGAAYVVYDPGNGTFFGITGQGIAFDSASSEHEQEPWFQQLLQLFYVERAAA